MRHLTLTENGTRLSLSGGRVIVYQKEDVAGEFPLNRIKTISVLDRGVSLSSNLLSDLSARGIRFFIIDFRGRAVVSVSGIHRHAVVEIRKKQFQAAESETGRELCRKFIYAKLRNQRAVLLYFSKYLKETDPDKYTLLLDASEKLEKASESCEGSLSSGGWRSELLGIEGNGAAVYWKALRESGLLPDSFKGRVGRGATDSVNQALNLGYTVLESYVWHALENAGLEIYSGFLHTDRPGKPSLVIDLMEEYRAWVVDRTVIKKRSVLSGLDSISTEIKKSIISEIHETFDKKYPYKKGKYRLESILQRQAYRLAASFFDKEYKPYLFKW